MGEGGAVDRQADRLRARGQDERAPRDRAAALGAHGARGGVDGDHGIVGDELDLLLAQRLFGAERDPLLGGRPREVVLRQVRPIDGARQLPADERDRAGVPFAPQRLRARGPGQARADDDDGGGAGGRRRARPERALRADLHQAPSLFTSKHAMGDSAGPPSTAPVRKSKHAWCHGQRTVAPVTSPSARGPP